MTPAGGYQRPTNPAPVSGPGALSKRTDGQAMQVLPDAQYGEAKQFAEAQAGAPMAQAPTPGGPSAVGAAPAPRPGFTDPSQEPGTPVTAGAAAGPGPGPEALGFQSQMSESTAALKKYLPTLMQMANDPSASPQSRAFVRWLQAKTAGSDAQA